MALELLIDGVDYITELVHESLTVDQTADGLNSTCSFDLLDRDVRKDEFWTVQETRVEDGDVVTDHAVFAEPKTEVALTDGAVVYFAGILVRAGYKHFGTDDMVLSCECCDFNQMVEEEVVDDLETYGAATDEEIIDDIFTKYVAGIGFAAHVTGPFVTDEITFESVTVRSVLDTLANKSNYKWHIGYDKELYYDAAGADAPAWHLSDSPDDVNSFSFFDDISMELDSANLVNMVFIVGSETALWFQDAVSIAQYGEHKAIIKDTNLVDIDDMEYKAEAILAKYKDPITTYTVKTYKDGLRAGMNVRLVCALYDVDATLFINSLTVTFPVDGDPVYEINCGGLKSSAGASAARLSLDGLTDLTIIPPGQLPMAARGWGHDMTFTAPDFETVAWGVGTLTTAGGYTFAIAAGNTDNPGAMVGKTIVYLDTSVSLTDLQVTTVETAAIGTNKIMVAVCWPGLVGPPEVLAGFQVFGSTTEVATYLNATNIIANSITGNEIVANSIDTIHLVADAVEADKIDVATLDAISANMGTLTAGTIQTGVAGNDRVVINIADGIVGYDNLNVIQFQLDPADGKAYAGAGDVVLDEDGITIVSGVGNRNKITFTDAGVIRASYSAEATATYATADIVGGPPDNNADYGRVSLVAEPFAGFDPTRIRVVSEKAGADGYIQFMIAAALEGYWWPGRLEVTNDIRVGGGIYVGGVGVAPAGDAVFVLGDAVGLNKLYVKDSAVQTRLTIDSDGSLIAWKDISALGNLAASGTVQTTFGNAWNLGSYTAVVPVIEGYLTVIVDGTTYRLACERL